MPETKKYCPSFNKGNTLLLRAIFQVWTDKTVNILCISSLPCKTQLFLLVYLLVTSQRAIPLSIARQSTNQIARKAVLHGITGNNNIILTLVSVHTEKYCPKQKKYCPSFSEGNTLLLRAIFQVWTDKTVNILCIASLPCKTRLFVISLLTCDVIPVHTAQYCTAIGQSDCTKSRIAWHNWQ